MACGEAPTPIAPAGPATKPALSNGLPDGLQDLMEFIQEPAPAPQERDGIFFSNGKTLYRSSYDGSDVLAVLTSPEHHYGDFEIDAEGGKIYWLEPDARKKDESTQHMNFDRESFNLVRANLDGSHKKFVANIGRTYGVKDFVIDVNRRKIYWRQKFGSYREGKIWQGTFHRDWRNHVLIEEYDGQPEGGLVFDPVTKRVYWVRNTSGRGQNNIGGHGPIAKSTIKFFDPDNAQVRELIVEYGGEPPSGEIGDRNLGAVRIGRLAIDAEGRKIYWRVTRTPYDSDNHRLSDETSIYLRLANLENGSEAETLSRQLWIHNGELPIEHMAVDGFNRNAFFTRGFSAYGDMGLYHADLEDLQNARTIYTTTDFLITNIRIF